MDRKFKQFIQSSTLFKNMDSIVIDEVIDAFQYQRLLRGETLFEEGDKSSAFYILLSGKLKIMVNRPNAELVPGDCFGEISLISNGSRTATIMAIRDSELGKLDKAQFETLMQFHPEIAIEMLKVISEWLDSKNKQVIRSRTEVITLINLDVASAKAGIGAKLSLALGGDEKVKLLSKSRWKEQLSPQHIAPQQQDEHFREDLVSRWISEQESAHRYVVLEATPLQSRWRDFCLRQADRVLYVVQNTSDPKGLELKSIPTLYPETTCNLLLLHEGTNRKPVNTARWFRHFKVSQHFHLLTDCQESIGRLAREVSGKSVALVLGGGGARSFSQIGVLKALHAQSVKIDKIGGTGMGAVIAAQYADGYSPDEILALNKETWTKQKPHKAFTLPVSSLLKADKAVKLMKNMFGERHIEDLWLNFFCVSTDLTRLESKIHKNGELWSALMASGAIPGICSPIVSDDGSLLVDGGILDNLPVANMRKHHSGKIIAVDVSPNRGLFPYWKDTIPPNGFKALWQHINPGSKSRPFPNIYKLIAHTATLASKINSEQSRGEADLCLKPDCRQHGLMQMNNLEALVRYGYDSTYENIRSWLAED